MLKFFIFIYFTFHTADVFSELYRCENESGQIQFTDHPCPNQGQIFTPKAVMTDYKTIEAPKRFNQKTPSTHTIKTCPFINSTELRNLRVKDQYKKGLRATVIEQRLGKAHDVSQNKNKSVWIYNHDYVKRIFRFKDGCLTGWKEKWNGKESKISKYRDER